RCSVQRSLSSFQSMSEVIASSNDLQCGVSQCGIGMATPTPGAKSQDFGPGQISSQHFVRVSSLIPKSRTHSVLFCALKPRQTNEEPDTPTHNYRSNYPTPKQLIPHALEHCRKDAQSNQHEEEQPVPFDQHPQASCTTFIPTGDPKACF